MSKAKNKLVRSSMVNRIPRTLDASKFTVDEIVDAVPIGTEDAADLLVRMHDLKLAKLTLKLVTNDDGSTMYQLVVDLTSAGAGYQMHSVMDRCRLQFAAKLSVDTRYDSRYGHKKAVSGFSCIADVGVVLASFHNRKK